MPDNCRYHSMLGRLFLLFLVKEILLQIEEEIEEEIEKELEVEIEEEVDIVV